MEIRFRRKDLIKTMRRLDPIYTQIVEQLGEYRVYKIREVWCLNYVPHCGKHRALFSTLFALGTPELSELERKSLENKLKAREEQLLPIYHQIAVKFADLHDTPGRMQEKGVITVKNSLFCFLFVIFVALSCVANFVKFADWLAFMSVYLLMITSHFYYM